MGKILFLAGSARRDSMNKKLARQAYELAVEKGANATLLDLSDYSMPLYDGDLEAADGLPDAARRLKKVFAEHQAPVHCLARVQRFSVAFIKEHH